MSVGKLTKKLNKASNDNIEEKRDYIGASSIGHPCYRRIWFAINDYPQTIIAPRPKRILEMGKMLEGMIINWLREVGLIIQRIPFAVIDKQLTYFKGHYDALIVNKDGSPLYILEIKTAKDSSFSQFKSHGLKRWNEQYYAQVQSYMGMSGIKKSIIIVLNKDNADMWDEEIEFDEAYYLGLRDKAKLIKEAKIAPPRVNGSPLYYLCRMCPFSEECHK
jgi:hypothetical protein